MGILGANHPLATLHIEDGFQIKKAPVLPPSDMASGENPSEKTLSTVELIMAGTVPRPPKPECAIPGYHDLRTVIPFTEGRALSWKLVEHLTKARARNWPQIKPWEFYGESVAICGGGPSLAYTLPELRELQKQGCKVLAINRTHDFLLNLPKTHGVPWIKPWAGILLEAIPHAAQYMTPTSGVRYFISSQCAPESFDRYEKNEHYIWHARSKPEHEAALLPEERRLMVPAIGSTCGLRSIVLMYMLGFGIKPGTAIHLFGMDSCYHEYEILNGIHGVDGLPKLHSYAKAEAIHDVKELLIKDMPDGDHTYYGNANMIAQADEFQIYLKWREEMMARKHIDPHTLVVHGFGAIPDIARAFYGKPSANSAETSERKAS